jgi:transposase
MERGHTMRRTDVLKAREILRLKNEFGFSIREIARASGCGKTTVSDVLERAAKADLTWPFELNDKELMSRLYPPTERVGRAPEPDLEYIYKEMKRKNVTLSLLWEEYKSLHPEGLMYTQFCERYRDFKKANNIHMHKEHKAGEEMEVDWAGSTVPYFDRDNMEEKDAHIFVSVLPASSYPFAKAFVDETTPNWIKAHTDAFEFIGGVPAIMIPDNTKTAVITPSSSDPVFNRSYKEMARHYGCAIMPARPRKPKDKGADEGMVRIVGQRILAALRNRKFFGIEEVNAAIAEELEKLIDRPFKKLEGNRRSAFEEIDKPELQPLPKNRYEYSDWKEALATPDYHVEYVGFFYSVPHEYRNTPCTVRATVGTIEIFNNGERITVHERNYNKKKPYTTLPEHMPKSHQLVSGRGKDHFISLAGETGPMTKELVKQIYNNTSNPTESYRICTAILKLASESNPEDVEKASREAIELELISFKYFKMLIGKQRHTNEVTWEEKVISHRNIRGNEAFSGGAANA